jgi:hypothetical protein
MKIKRKPIEHIHIHRLTQNELVEEAERLEALLNAGELTPKEARHLVKVRDALLRLEIVKDGWI